jgi:hypothetical protein
MPFCVGCGLRGAERGRRSTEEKPACRREPLPAEAPAPHHRPRAPKAALQLAGQHKGTGHGHGPDLAHGFAAAAKKGGEALVAIGLDAIRVGVHHQGADLAGGAVLIAIERGAKDSDPAPAPLRRQGPPQRPSLIFVAKVEWGGVGSPEQRLGASGWGAGIDREMKEMNIEQSVTTNELHA